MDERTIVRIMGFIQEFKTFISKGNVMDLAIGVIIGAAFGKIVTSLVEDVFMPILGKIVGGIDFTGLKYVIRGTGKDEVALRYGNFLQTTFNFLIIAFCVFLMVKALNAMKRKQETAVETPPDVKLLTEIRDLLAKR
jgi:large conductance mechanosensitive channel